MILKATLLTVASQVVAQFWADSLEIRKEVEKAREATQVQIVCGMVSMEVPHNVPEYNLQCDPYDDQSQGD